MSNHTEAWMEKTCPACGDAVSSSGSLNMAKVILSSLLGMAMVAAVLASLVFTYYQATLETLWIAFLLIRTLWFFDLLHR